MTNISRGSVSGWQPPADQTQLSSIVNSNGVALRQRRRSGFVLDARMPVDATVSVSRTPWLHLCMNLRPQPHAAFRGNRKIPIYELSRNDGLWHNGRRGAIQMAKAVCCFLSELLQIYQERTHKTCTEMALDFDITLSNLYLYRTGKGNPRASTIDKIVSCVQRQCPEAFQEVSRW